MKKRILLITLFVSVFLVPQVHALVQKQALMREKAVAQKEPVKPVEYTLPFPGILPDNPLYVFKSVRDRILDWLIVEPVRKGEFAILQADKRLGMGSALTEKGNTILAETTFSKGEKYMEKAVSVLTALKAGGKEIPGYLLDRLEKSLAKHIEVFDAIIEKSNEAAKPAVSNILNDFIRLQGEAAKLK